jgi:CHAD domain-containing protein
VIGSRSPISIVQEQSVALLGHLPGVREGDDTAIHDARVLTRRLRELLTIAKSELNDDAFAEISRVMQRAGRALGHVRDLDVAQQLLMDLERHIPAAAAVTGPLRSTALQDQRRARRDLIKTLEGLDLESLPRRTRRGRRSGFRWPSTEWQSALRNHIGARAADVNAAVHHATGVYFPNRAHSARLAIKKLRYALELAQATDLWRVDKSAKRLAKAQDALGQAHDRELLIDRLRGLAETDQAQRRIALDLAVPFVEGEISALWQRYLGRREQITEICDTCLRFARPRRSAPALVAAGAAIPSLVLIGSHIARTRREESTAKDIRVNVSVEEPSEFSERSHT